MKHSRSRSHQWRCMRSPSGPGGCAEDPGTGRGRGCAGRRARGGLGAPRHQLPAAAGPALPLAPLHPVRPGQRDWAGGHHGRAQRAGGGGVPARVARRQGRVRVRGDHGGAARPRRGSGDGAAADRRGRLRLWAVAPALPLVSARSPAARPGRGRLGRPARPRRPPRSHAPVLVPGAPLRQGAPGPGRTPGHRRPVVPLPGVRASWPATAPLRAAGHGARRASRRACVTEAEREVEAVQRVAGSRGRACRPGRGGPPRRSGQGRSRRSRAG